MKLATYAPVDATADQVCVAQILQNLVSFPLFSCWNGCDTWSYWWIIVRMLSNALRMPFIKYCHLMPKTLCLILLMLVELFYCLSLQLYWLHFRLFNSHLLIFQMAADGINDMLPPLLSEGESVDVVFVEIWPLIAWSFIWHLHHELWSMIWSSTHLSYLTCEPWPVSNHLLSDDTWYTIYKSLICVLLSYFATFFLILSNVLKFQMKWCAVCMETVHSGITVESAEKQN